MTNKKTRKEETGGAKQKLKEKRLGEGKEDFACNADFEFVEDAGRLFVLETPTERVEGKHALLDERIARLREESQVQGLQSIQEEEEREKRENPKKKKALGRSASRKGHDHVDLDGVDFDEGLWSNNEDSSASSDTFISDEDDSSPSSKKSDSKSFFEEDFGRSLPRMETFAEMNLSRLLLKALMERGFERPTPIQMAAIPVALMGKDICGGAETGSGKTAAFLVPIIERLLHRQRMSGAAIRVLILLPTRELAVQCHEVAVQLARHTDIRFMLAAGGMPRKAQEEELRRRPEVLIATPGRLIDHLHNATNFTLERVEILVLDEADRMLEEGFVAELDEIIRQCPRPRQTMLFSATMTEEVSELVRLSLEKPVRLLVDPTMAIARRLKQEFVRIYREREKDRLTILLALCYRIGAKITTVKGNDGVEGGKGGREGRPLRTIIFFPTKHLTHRARLLWGLVGLRVAELHGGLTQADRLDALTRFKNGAADFLLATDVAARGLDIPAVEIVLNYSMPVNYKQYLHRVGRTARAGRTGRAITLVGAGADRKLLKLVSKNSTEPIQHRKLAVALLEKCSRLVARLEEPLKQLLEEEKEQAMLTQAEHQLSRAENILAHNDEIQSRPPRTWFQTPQQKRQAKRRDRDQSTDDQKLNKEKTKKTKLAPVKDRMRKGKGRM